ncbi:MAG: Uma2 family endonuclease [Blastocatellia bacterium]
MALKKIKPWLSVAEYLASEQDAAARHEYVNGQAHAMAGASDRHNRIAGNIYARLLTHLGAGPCEPFMSDMKVRVDDTLFYYPDVVVTCDEAPRDPYFRTQPRLVFEVLSPTTARVDLLEKLLAYRNTPGLLEYVIVSQDEMRVTVHRRTADGWRDETFDQPGAEIRFESVGLSMRVSEIYRYVNWPEEG